MTSHRHDLTYRTRNLADIFEMLVTYGKSFNSNCCSPNNLSVSVENRFSFKISSPRWLVYVLPSPPAGGQGGQRSDPIGLNGVRTSSLEKSDSSLPILVLSGSGSYAEVKR